MSLYIGSSEVKMNLDPITAAINSNLGSVSSLSGATRVFDIMRDDLQNSK